VVHPNRAPGIETAAFHAVNSLPGFIYVPAWIVMQLGNLLAAPAAALVAAALRRFRLAVALLGATVAKIYVAVFIKDIWLRQRPASVIEDVIRRGDASATGKAFVSGHAIVAFAIATLVAPYLPPRSRSIAWALAVTVCVGRVYVGAHLPLDVVGGAATGWAIGCLLNFVLGRPPGQGSRFRPRRGLNSDAAL
jgi:undecaprenyl-diphosphatase